MQFGLHQIVTPTTERILSIFRSVLLRAWSCKQTKGHGAEQCQDEAVGLSLHVFTKSLQLEIVDLNKTPEQSAGHQPFVFPQTVYCWGSHCFLSGLSLACRLVSHVVSHLVWDAASAFKACLPSCLRWSGMLCRALRLSPKFHVRFVQLFRVYCGVISILSL